MACLAGITATISGCAQITTQTMVFGERTGLNIGINVDPAKATPFEFNTGFRRQVVGIIPASKLNELGEADGEATNMISHFELEQPTDEDANPFNEQIAMRGAFISGKAALELLTPDNETVNAVVSKVAEEQVSSCNDSTESESI
jgi:hypothetical protein